MELTEQNVHNIFMGCLFRDDEDMSNFVKAEGIQATVGFHPERLESNRENVQSMLFELPKEFMKSGGGGWSFLQACNDQHGRQWADSHAIMDELFILGQALKLVESLFPRTMWAVLSGGMPYYQVIDS